MNTPSVVTTRPNFFYTRIEVNSVDFASKADIEFPFTPTKIIIVRTPDCFDQQVLSWAFRCGDDVDGELFQNDGPIAFDWGTWTSMWLKGEFASQPMTVRVWAWRL